MLRSALATAGLAAVLASGAAQAADLPSRVAPAPYVAPPVFTWTGFTVGTLTGYSFSDRQTVVTRGNNGAGVAGVTDTIGTVANGRRPAAVRIGNDGFTSFGGGIGYDYQFGAGSGLVVGAAADATMMDLTRRRGYVGPAAFGSEIAGFRQTLDWLGTVRGRVGYGFDRFLVYGTGGFAYGNTLYRAAFLNPAGAIQYGGQYDGIQTGWAAGAGFEYALPTDSFLTKFSIVNYFLKADAITLKVEYLHYDLGARNVLVGPALAGTTGSYTSRFRTEGDLVRGGFTYRFNGL